MLGCAWWWSSPSLLEYIIHSMADQFPSSFFSFGLLFTHIYLDCHDDVAVWTFLILDFFGGVSGRLPLRVVSEFLLWTTHDSSPHTWRFSIKTRLSWVSSLLNNPINEKQAENMNTSEEDSSRNSNGDSKKKISSKGLGRFLKEQRGRLYIVRRCVVMLLCWQDWFIAADDVVPHLLWNTHTLTDSYIYIYIYTLSLSGP